MSKIEVKMRQRINRKFEKVGANSKKNAVPLMDANLDLQEQYWLPYLVGSVLGSIRKTSDNRYYNIQPYANNTRVQEDGLIS